MTQRKMTNLCIAKHRREPARPRRALDGAYICAGCMTQLTDNLHDLSRLYEDLGEHLAVAGTSGQRVSGSPGTPLPINTGVAEHRAQIKGVLASWALLVVYERGITPPESTAVTGTAPLILAHSTWAAGHDWIDELVHEVRALTIRARRLLDPDRHLATGERCRVIPKGEDRCAGTITMIHTADETWTARCDVCGPQEAASYLHGRTTGRWVTVDRVVTYARRVHAIKAEPSTVRYWAHRGNVTTQKDAGRVWYDLASIDRYLTERSRRTG